MSRRGAMVAAGACALALSACGSGASRPATTGVRSPAASVPATSASNGEAGKRASQIVSDAAAAVRGARSYRLAGTVTAGHQRIRLDLAIGSPTTLELSFVEGPTAFEVIDLPGRSFVRANAAFWRTHGGARGARLSAQLSGRWIAVPTFSVRGLAAAAGPFEPAILSRCLTENHGTLRVAGTTTVAGQRSIVIRDEGNAPGDAPGALYVAATGTPYPLRVTQHGYQRAGGRIDVCNDGKAGSSSGDVTLGEFNRVPAIAPPVATAASPKV